MKKLVYKRALAFLIDTLIVSLLIILMNIATGFEIPESPNISEYSDMLIREEITASEYIDTIIVENHEQEIETLNNSLVNISILILVFIIIPFFNKKTIGQALTGLKFKEKIKIHQLFIRNAVVNGLLFSIISLSTVFILDPKPYFALVGVLAIFQIVIVIKSGFMVLLNEDSKGLQDLWSKSEVIVEEV